MVDLYNNDSGKFHSAPGLCLVPKLKYQHVHLTSVRMQKTFSDVLFPSGYWTGTFSIQISDILFVECTLTLCGICTYADDFL